MTKQKKINLTNAFKDVKKRVKSTLNIVDRTVDIALHGKGGYGEGAKRFLERYGNEIIVSVQINRDPIMTGINKILDLFGGQTDFDKLFHLRMNIFCQSGFKCTFEKNERITLTGGQWGATKKHGDMLEIPFRPMVSINTFLNNTQKYMGSKYFPYSGSSNNCQDYVTALLVSNGYNNSETLKFVKQDTENIFKNKPFLRKTANTVTTLAGNTSSVLGFGIGDNDTFTKFKKVDMTKLIQQYNKNTHVIKQYSKLPVKSMRHMLSHHFTLVNNQLVRKNEVTNAVVSEPNIVVEPVTKEVNNNNNTVVVSKAKKRIIPNIVSVNTPTKEKQNINNSSMTAGQKRYARKIQLLEDKEKNKPLRAAFNMLRK